MRARIGRGEPLRLDHVIGMSTLSGAALVGSATGNDVYYIAGCAVVRYNHVTKTQKRFYMCQRPVACIALTADGRYLAAGERGNTPSITVWDILKEEKVTTLMGHKHGVGCMRFSPNGRYLVSAGFKPDKQLIVWHWDSGKKLSTQKLSNKVHALSFHHSGDYFVTAGDRHLKWWHLSEIADLEVVTIEGLPASITEDHRTSVFVDVACGSYNCDGKVFCISAAGVLSVFNENRMMEHCVQVESTPAYSLEVFTAEGAPGLLVAGCANGEVLAYSPLDLEFIATLPPPAPLASGFSAYPACYAVRKVPGSRLDPVPKLAAVFADRSLFIWNISDIYDVTLHASFLSHRSCVWDVQFVDAAAGMAAGVGTGAEGSGLPAGAFFTCSADNTIRCWAVDGARGVPKASEFSDQLLCAVELRADDADAVGEQSMLDHRSVMASTATGLSVTQQQVGVVHFDFSRGVPDTELPDRPQSAYSPRCLAVHPFGHELACGDKTGQLRIFDLHTMQQTRSVQAHSAEILTLAYSPPMVRADGGQQFSLFASEAAGAGEVGPEHALVLLASAGRDRLIHIFEANRSYCPVDTLDHHSSSVIVVRFTCDGKKLISCGGDKAMVFCHVNGATITRMKTVQVPQGTINGLALDPANKFAVTSGQDKRLNIWNVHTGKLVRGYRSAEVAAELYKADLDPSGTYIAACGFDKTVTLVDFFSGEVVAQVSGHSELITGVKFSPDGLSLVTIGGDGCVMVWKIADLLVKAMKDRMLELYASAQKRNARAVVRSLAATGLGSAPVPPAPLPLPPAPPAASLSSIKQKALTRLGSERQSSESADGARKSRWQVDADAGYELFGRKVAPHGNKNKFTLELTSAALAERTIAPAQALPPQPPSRDEERGAVATDDSAAHLGDGNRLAADVEDLDKVMHGLSSDEEDEAMFQDFDAPPSPARAHSPATTPGPVTGPDEEIAAAQRKISNVERSAHDLESWLENMLKSEGQLAARADPTPPAATSTSQRGALGQSLSSAFFRGAKPSASASASATQPQSVPSVADEEADNDRKLRDSAAMVSQMRERLRVMDSSSCTDGLASVRASAMVAASASAVPPAPPAREDEQRAAATSAAEQVAEKTRDYQRILRELDAAKERAAQSFQELVLLRTSLETGTLGETAQAGPGDTSEQARMSLQETDALLEQFRRSLATFQDVPLQQTASATAHSFGRRTGPGAEGLSLTATGSSAGEDFALTAFLEKYSDRLVEIVGEKILLGKAGRVQP